MLSYYIEPIMPFKLLCYAMLKIFIMSHLYYFTRDLQRRLGLLLINSLQHSITKNIANRLEPRSYAKINVLLYDMIIQRKICDWACKDRAFVSEQNLSILMFNLLYL